MRIINNSHLSYCTNIHSGETFKEVWNQLKEHTTIVYKKIETNTPFGIGLRLSALAAKEVLENNQLFDFKDWLFEHNMYVFTLNGFPYGGFHHTTVKDKVHHPDWQTRERMEYTKNLCDILSVLLPETVEGGISTSPLSYKYWYTKVSEIEEVKHKSCIQLLEVVRYMIKIKEQTGKLLHLDIEPEPDGVIETSDEWIDFFKKYLIPNGVTMLTKQLNMTSLEAETAIRTHVQLCYDICHFAVGYEDPEVVVGKMDQYGINIGKMQISSALKVNISKDEKQLAEIKNLLINFDEPTYLHQTVLKKREGGLQYYRDLKPALKKIDIKYHKELRTHFHVPVFTHNYSVLQSTQDDIIKTLNLWRKDPFTKHLEVETYTWEVLPDELKTDMDTLIFQEIEWVIQNLQS